MVDFAQGVFILARALLAIIAAGFVTVTTAIGAATFALWVLFQLV